MTLAIAGRESWGHGLDATSVEAHLVGGAAPATDRAPNLAEDAQGLVPVETEVGRDAKGELYFTMKLVEGQSLKALIGGAPIADVDRLFNLLEIFVKICDALGSDLGRRVAANYQDYRLLAERDRRNIKRLSSELETGEIIEVPYLDRDVHDLAGLMEVNRYLFG